MNTQLLCEACPSLEPAVTDYGGPLCGECRDRLRFQLAETKLPPAPRLPAALRETVAPPGFAERRVA